MIRKAEIGDVPAIRAMADIAFRDTYRNILTSDQIEYMMEMMYSDAVLSRQIGTSQAVFLIEEGQGYASVKQEVDGSYLLDKIYILPEWQNTGLGRRLFNAVCETVREMAGADATMRLYVNRFNRAVSFYEHMGMRKVAERDNPIGHGYYMNDYIMQIELKTVTVVAAVILRDGKVFATQRGQGEWKDWWEFPGGKIEAGESAQEALVREIREELDSEIQVGELLCTVDYDYPKFHLTMHCYLCRVLAGSLTLLEHEDARWLAAGELESVRWLPADGEIIQLLKVRGL